VALLVVGPCVGSRQLRALAHSPHLTSLSSLALNGNSIGNAGARALLAARCLPDGLDLTMNLSRISSQLRAQLRGRFDVRELRGD
jgi:hypothetical protein